MPNYKLRCKDVDGALVVMTAHCYNRHKSKRAELRDPAFFPAQVIRTLQSPSFTIKGRVANTKCYYLEEYSKDGIVRYTKVIVDISHRQDPSGGVCYICTVFRPDNIKELDYGYKLHHYSKGA